VSPRLSEAEYKALCAKVLQRDGWKCRSCGLRQNLACHHVVYRSQQGVDAAYNLLTLCEQCHTAVHRKDLEMLPNENGAVDANLPVQFVRHNNWRPYSGGSSVCIA
jgi:5-methylcytosine-specific restriction endonuclease McrA